MTDPLEHPRLQEYLHLLRELLGCYLTCQCQRLLLFITDGLRRLNSMGNDWEYLLRESSCYLVSCH